MHKPKPSSRKAKAARIIFIVLGALLIADTVLVRMRSNWNLGVLLPALLGLPLLVYGIWQPQLSAWFKQKAGRIVKWIFIGGYILIGTVTAVFSVMMVNAAQQQPNAGANAVVVLGAGIRGDQVSYALQNRLDAAAGYYHENPGTVLVVSGGYGKGKQYSEAYAMEKYLLSINIPAKDILKEERSTSTNENFRYSKEILDGMFQMPYSVVYGTNDFHILRAGINAREEGLSAQGLAAPTPPYILANCYLREALALFATYVFGV